MPDKQTPDDLIWGRHPVLEALRAERPLRRLLIAKGAHGPVIDEIFTRARQAHIPYDLRDKAQLDRLAGPRHQSVVAYAAAATYADFDHVLSHLSAPALLVFLDQVQDPHNLGAIIRSAHALGAQSVVVPSREAAGLSPAALKAAAGATQHLPVCRVDNLQKALQKAAAGGLFIAGLDAQGEQPLPTADLAQPCALVIGSEGKGLRRMVQKRCDALLHIPMQREAIGSLNASVAAGIALYEVFRQRQP
ncbi:MAG: 23S rRNA (guanosine(2251)-2'-O)-methyltransferase RlmB [Gemmatimonadetes bacterium]|nr:23S rRNA (guanosine(2251)-2'-O)-methyltransferase RlmB [Gemmatimonadota bacterium]MYC73012.1 23S rRNA (guanosine(2251)-2'-O)-methyltransferase RlmB [Gemmatimonadota bacterium]MYI60768.1 23S rRNA (guanosine(2251)-2'-O)-methyltransferase RlmB [Gemmatimonadota bacterium]